jgi:hypothetical protein
MSNMSKRNATRLATAGAVATAAAFGAYVFAVRPWFLRWGATDAEGEGVLPGDELVPEPKHHDTHAITIHAPIAQVWPWLVQVGQGKGGFYSYAWLENLAGCHLHNADTIVPEYQTLKAGDTVRLHPSAPPLTAVIVEPHRSIVLAGGGDKAATPPQPLELEGGSSALAGVPGLSGAGPLRHGAQDAAGHQGARGTSGTRRVLPAGRRPRLIRPGKAGGE